VLEFSPQQPSLQSLVQRISHELSAKAVVLLHENGQVLHRSGWMEDNDYPAMAALVAAMISAGKTLGSIGDSFAGAPSRFSCDSEAMGLYTVAVSSDIWLAVLYEQPLNPGLFRMKVRKYSDLLARFGVSRNEQWEIPPGATLPPVSSQPGPASEKSTRDKSSLFVNITDEEIDQLFENPSS
jgi:hypothetical protein